MSEKETHQHNIKISFSIIDDRMALNKFSLEIDFPKEDSYASIISDSKVFFESFLRDAISYRYFNKPYKDLLLTQQSYVSSFLNEF